MPKKATFVVAGILGVALAIAFLGNLALRIAEIPLLIIVFGVLAMMVWDFIDTTRSSLRANGAAKRNTGQSGN